MNNGIASNEKLSSPVAIRCAIVVKAIMGSTLIRIVNNEHSPTV